MAMLYQKNNVTISDDVIEIDGDRFTPDQLWQVRVSKNGSEFKSVLVGTVFLIAGLYAAFSLGWTILGWILISIGVLLLAVNLTLVLQGKVITYVYVAFVIDGNIKNSISKMIVIDDYNEAVELQKLIRSVGHLK